MRKNNCRFMINFNTHSVIFNLAEIVIPVVLNTCTITPAVLLGTSGTVNMILLFKTVINISTYTISVKMGRKDYVTERGGRGPWPFEVSASSRLQ